MWRASENLANLSLTVCWVKDLPSAYNLISSGMVYPLEFFQFEMQGGIFQFFWSYTVIFRCGECIIGTGGEPGPLMIFLCLKEGGANGSS